MPPTIPALHRRLVTLCRELGVECMHAMPDHGCDLGHWVRDAVFDGDDRMLIESLWELATSADETRLCAALMVLQAVPMHLQTKSLDRGAPQLGEAPYGSPGCRKILPVWASHGPWTVEDPPCCARALTLRRDRCAPPSVSTFPALQAERLLAAAGAILGTLRADRHAAAADA